MLLTITTTHSPATDLGRLLHKHPERFQTFPLAFGKAHVFYPEADQTRCTAALLLDIDPVGLVRGKSHVHNEPTLDHYVNDRPYAASSFLSVAIAQVFGTALSGRCKDAPALAETPIPLVLTLPVLPCRGGEAYLRGLFEPLGYQITAHSLPLDERFPQWGDSRHFSVTLAHTLRLSDALSHLYVLIPTLDDEKHYWVGEDEVEKLLRHGEGWLGGHPMREKIAHRYLKRQLRLTRLALARLTDEDNSDPDAAEARNAGQEEAIERGLSLNQQRLEAVLSVLKNCGARRVLDLGCGEGKFLRKLLQERDFEKIVGVDVSCRALEIAAERLRLDRLSPFQSAKIELLHGSLTYQDDRLRGYDAAVVIEVIEHLDPDRLAAFERALFERIRPNLAVVTTPNSEYNIRFETLAPGAFRHRDHRFEWTRREFQSWANGAAARFGYHTEFLPVGTEDAEVGAPTQMGVFTL
jgi:3' terminal RNA ribose 2'-O-methyltransferase Hen1